MSLVKPWSSECKRGWFLHWRNENTFEKAAKPERYTLTELVELYNSEILKECLHECKGRTDEGVKLYLERTNIRVPEQPRWLLDARKTCQQKCQASENFTACLAECFYEKTIGFDE